MEKKAVVFVTPSLGNVLMGLGLYLDVTFLLSQNGKACMEPVAGAARLGPDPAGGAGAEPLLPLPPAPLLLGQGELWVPEQAWGWLEPSSGTPTVLRGI